MFLPLFIIVIVTQHSVCFLLGVSTFYVSVSVSFHTLICLIGIGVNMNISYFSNTGCPKKMYTLFESL